MAPQTEGEMSFFEQHNLDLTELLVLLDGELQIVSVRNPAFAFGHPLAGQDSAKLPTLTSLIHPDDLSLLEVLRAQPFGQLVLRLPENEDEVRCVVGDFRRDADQSDRVRVRLVDAANLLGRTASVVSNALVHAPDDSGLTVVDILDQFVDPLLIKDEKGDFLLCNRAVAKLYGTTPEAMVGRHDDDFGVPGNIADVFRENVLNIMARGEAEVVFEDSRDADSGELHHYRSFKKPFKDAHGRNRILVHAQDVTDIVKSERRLLTVLDITREGVWDWHLPSGHVVLNRQWYRSLDFDEGDIDPNVGEMFRVIHPEDRDRVVARLEALAAGRTTVYSSEHRLVSKSGRVIWVQDRARVAERDADDQPLRLVGSFIDVSEQRRHKHQLEILAHYDSLTGLPNRVLLADRLQQAMAQARRQGVRLAVAYIDLDGFKHINDAYGHATGDRLLSALAARFRGTLREGDTIARLGGDEFVAVLTNLNDEHSSARFVSRLLDVASAPVELDGEKLKVSASVGVSFYPQEDEPGADQLLRQADQAMYQAKLAGRNRFHFFDTEFDRNMRGRHECLARIERALVHDEFELHYQPQVNLRTGQVVGAEALIRWRHPARGLLGPALFLPELEREQLGVRLGEWVLDKACAQIVAWNREGLNLTVSVNVSAFHLGQADFANRLRERLVHDDAPLPGQLELEVLETSALDDTDAVESAFAACAELGVRIALDDFGTGYCSLAYLRRLPAQVLKIDRSFVSDMLDDPDDLAILQGVIGLGNAFRRDLVAEGVETVDQGLMLLQLGCDMAQGYGIARPMPAAEVAEWVRHWKAPVDWLDARRLRRDMVGGIQACVETRAHLCEIERYATGLRPFPPQIDVLRCSMSRWLNREASRFAAEPLYGAIKDCFGQLVIAAQDVVSLVEDGSDASLARDRLVRLRDAMTQQLLALLRQVGEIPGSPD